MLGPRLCLPAAAREPGMKRIPAPAYLREDLIKIYGKANAERSFIFTGPVPQRVPDGR